VTTFVLVPGAGGNASYWRELVAELESRGHEALPVDIAQDDPALGLPEYADLVAAAIGPRTDAVLVAQSLGGFTAPMVPARRPVRMIVLVNAMIPLPGESPGEWGDATGADAAREAADEAAGRDREIDLERHFLHDLPDDVRAQMEQDPPPRGVADTIWGQPCDIDTGRTSPPTWSPGVTTASSPCRSSSGWRVTGSASSPTCSPAATCWRRAGRPTSPTGWSSTPRRFDVARRIKSGVRDGG